MPPDPTTTPTQTNPPPQQQHLPTKKRKRNQTHVIHQSTLRPQWTYFHLSLTTPTPPHPSSSSSSSPAHIDTLTLLPLLTRPLTAYLGATGAAIPLDVLQQRGREIWIRVARQDARGVRAALSSWVGTWEGGGVAWRVCGEGGRCWGFVGMEKGGCLGGCEGGGDKEVGL
ncbi:hypothetical protein GQ44DRAFT_680262 [Phaeosphaeriaceae sp. PMI808]|nr:hypothetical protein GQ44DRAFT_680262 [Phaeosphaeriaceae sp. PMI808]